MLTKLFYLACLISVSIAGEVYLPEDLIVRWSFNSDDTITFKYFIPLIKAIGPWGYAGFGIKNIEDGRSMIGADLVSIIMSDSTSLDRFAIENDYPPADVDEGCQDNLLDMKHYDEDKHRVYEWSRFLNTGDICDLPLYKDDDYYILWSFGNTKDGEIRYHRRRGTEPITLSDDFTNEGIYSSYMNN